MVVRQDHLMRMLGQFYRGGTARVPSRRPVAGRAKSEPMKQPPTERERAIAQRRTEGRTLQRLGREFGLTPEPFEAFVVAWKSMIAEQPRSATILRASRHSG